MVSNVVKLVEDIAKSLVDDPAAVEVTAVEGTQTMTVKLKVSPEDMGKVIGKQGRIAKAIRTVAKAAGTRENKKVKVDIN